VKLTRRRRLLWRLAYDDPWDWWIMRKLPVIIPLVVGGVVMFVRSVHR
jgi:hypothetical protein